MAKAIHESNPLLTINTLYPSFSKAEQKVADAVLANTEAVMYSSITDLAEMAGVGETTIIRFCRKLGFRGFQEFKLAVAQDLVSPRQQVMGKIEPSDGVDLIVQKVTAHNTQALDDSIRLLQPEALARASDALMRGRRLYFFGVGSSGITACDAQYRFMRLGFDAHVATDAHVIAMQCALVTPEDVVFGISTSGSTKDLVDAVRIAKSQGACIICLTSHARAPITSLADVVLLAAAKESPLQGGAFASKLVQIHVLDILSTIVSTRLGDRAVQAMEQTAKAVLDKLY
ncbi:MurR/RpiR family transcriptional regulator [Alicyclobacillus cellulosilyticus]|uniref:MurR/RpiR family transcriptional regulator n=1 Tax=Alicyclobacillus cellulosilyticus TaxID=1003997 RepID=UPI001E32305C|nr:MurR/RpiR family transcriptional regulator [Alicyclobacillus cellulosilyticus]